MRGEGGLQYNERGPLRGHRSKSRNTSSELSAVFLSSTAGDFKQLSELTAPFPATDQKAGLHGPFWRLQLKHPEGTPNRGVTAKPLGTGVCRRAPSSQVPASLEKLAGVRLLRAACPLPVPETGTCSYWRPGRRGRGGGFLPSGKSSRSKRRQTQACRQLLARPGVYRNVRCLGRMMRRFWRAQGLFRVPHRTSEDSGTGILRWARPRTSPEGSHTVCHLRVTSECARRRQSWGGA